MANDLRRAVGGNLRAIRKTRRLTQERFGYRYGYQRSWVGRVENAKQNLTMDSIQELADRLEMEVFALVRRPGEAPPPLPLAPSANGAGGAEEAR